MAVAEGAAVAAGDPRGARVAAAQETRRVATAGGPAAADGEVARRVDSGPPVVVEVAPRPTHTRGGRRNVARSWAGIRLDGGYGVQDRKGELSAGHTVVETSGLAPAGRDGGCTGAAVLVAPSASAPSPVVPSVVRIRSDARGTVDSGLRRRARALSSRGRGIPPPGRGARVPVVRARADLAPMVACIDDLRIAGQRWVARDCIPRNGARLPCDRTYRPGAAVQPRHAGGGRRSSRLSAGCSAEGGWDCPRSSRALSPGRQPSGAVVAAGTPAVSRIVEPRVWSRRRPGAILPCSLSSRERRITDVGRASGVGGRMHIRDCSPRACEAKHASMACRQGPMREAGGLGGMELGPERREAAAEVLRASSLSTCCCRCCRSAAANRGRAARDRVGSWSVRPRRVVDAAVGAHTGPCHHGHWGAAGRIVVASWEAACRDSGDPRRKWPKRSGVANGRMADGGLVREDIVVAMVGSKGEDRRSCAHGARSRQGSRRVDAMQGGTKAPTTMMSQARVEMASDRTVKQRSGRREAVAVVLDPSRASLSPYGLEGQAVGQKN